MRNTRDLKIILIFFFILITGILWLGFSFYGRYRNSTEDAYINANVVQISPRVTGAITHLYVKNNQYVQKDQLLFELDPVPFQISMASAKAQLTINEAQMQNATLTAKRVMDLLKKKFSSPQEGDNAVTALESASAAVTLAKAHLAQAELNMQYTRVRAPTSGWIANLTVRDGAVVAANQPLFALVSDEEFWVDANYKETELEAIKPGMKAKIITDLYPDHPFTGIVESISSGSGTVFSLLPPQNATGNWVKVTQRIPVRIHVFHPEPNYPLRIGASSKVIIDTRPIERG